MKFSANLGFLWKELSLPDAIRAAHRAGFDAVECHWPYETPHSEVVAALRECNFDMLGLNTVRGDVESGENGLAALPGREAEARAAIDQAVDYAASIGALNVHVMAGKAEGARALETYVSNLRYAAERAQAAGVSLLIEPLNCYDAPGYFLTTTGQAQAVIAEVGAENLRLMFDCYHVQIMEGDVSRRLERLLPLIGHIQFASVPQRSEPDRGELDYRHVFAAIETLGYCAPIGAEYRPGGESTEAGLSWMRDLPPN